jgi:hypothetical protein
VWVREAFITFIFVLLKCLLVVWFTGCVFKFCSIIRRSTYTISFLLLKLYHMYSIWINVPEACFQENWTTINLTNEWNLLIQPLTNLSSNSDAICWNYDCSGHLIESVIQPLTYLRGNSPGISSGDSHNHWTSSITFISACVKDWCCTVQVKVKFTLEQSMKVQRGSKGIALLFL